jgi:hypothetical protein
MVADMKIRHLLPISLLLIGSDCYAAQLSNEDIIARTRQVQAHPKSQAELEGVTLWCQDALMAPVLLEAAKHEADALKLMQADHLAEATRLIENADAEKKAARVLARSICRPPRQNR